MPLRKSYHRHSKNCDRDSKNYPWENSNFLRGNSNFPRDNFYGMWEGFSLLQETIKIKATKQSKLP